MNKAGPDYGQLSAVVGRPPPNKRLDWLPFVGLYATFGTTFGLLGTAAPLVLRARGVALDTLGLVQLMYLPIGIAFLWAPLLDRFTMPWLTHRRGWIVFCQGLTTVALVVLGRSTDVSFAAVIVLFIVAGVTLATMDISVEALVTETVERQRRPYVTTAKLIASSLGTSLGISLGTVAPERFALSHALLSVAVFDALMLLPLLGYREPKNKRIRENSFIISNAQRRRLLGQHALVVGFYFVPVLMLGTMTSLALVDLGISLPVVGLVTGPLTTAVNIITMLAAGRVLTQISSDRLVSALVLGPISGGLLFAAAMATHSGWLAISATLWIAAFEGALGIPVFNTLYRWAEGPDAATDYAVLFGISFLVSFPVRVIDPFVAALCGWPMFFLVSTTMFLFAAILLVRAMRATDRTIGAPQ
jgi:PAT family beta-lactamase induction signal transducer AmpG